MHEVSLCGPQSGRVSSKGSAYYATRGNASTRSSFNVAQSGPVPWLQPPQWSDRMECFCYTHSPT